MGNSLLHRTAEQGRSHINSSLSGILQLLESLNSSSTGQLMPCGRIILHTEQAEQLRAAKPSLERQILQCPVKQSDSSLRALMTILSSLIICSQ